MSKQSKVIKAGLGYTIGNYLLKGISFISVPIYTRLLSTSDYGLFNNFLTYNGILFILIGCAIHGSYKSARFRYKVPSEGADKGKDYYTYASDTILFVLALGILGLIVVNLFSSFFVKLLMLDKFSLNLLFIYSIATALITCFNSDVSIEYEYKKFLLISGFNAVGTVLVSITLLLTIFSKKRYFGMIIGSAAPSVIAAIYVIIYFFNRSKPRLKNILLFLKWGLGYSLPIVPHGLSQVILNQFDRIMITKMVSISANGIYSFAYNIYSILGVTFNSLDNVWAQWFYDQMRIKEYSKIKKISSMYIYLMFVFTASVILISPELIMILGQKSYWSAKYVAIPVVAGGYFAFLYTIPATVEYYYSKTVWLAGGTMLVATINIFLNFIFIPKFGYIAAAYSTLVTYILYFCFHFFIAKEIQGKNLFSTYVISGCSLGILLSASIAYIFINSIWIRWILVFVLGIGSLMYDKKHDKIIIKLVKVLKNKRS